MQVRRGRVAGVTDVAEHVARRDAVTDAHTNASRPEMREARVHVAGPQDHVVAEDGRDPVGTEGHAVPHHARDLAERVDPSPLADAVGGRDHLGVERRVDLRVPRVALIGAPAHGGGGEGRGGVHVHARAVVDLDEVERVALPEDVDPVTRDAGSRCRDGHPPVPAQGEFHHHRVIELAHGSQPAQRSRTQSSVTIA